MKQQEIKPSKEFKEFVKSLPVLGDNTLPQPATVEEAARAYAEGKSSSSVFQEAHIADFIAGYNYAQQPESNPEAENIWQWLCARIHPLKGRGDYKFWIKQAFEMWSERKPDETLINKVNAEFDENEWPEQDGFVRIKKDLLKARIARFISRATYFDRDDEPESKPELTEIGMEDIISEMKKLAEPTGGKSLQECKDEYARIIGHKDWKEFLGCYPDSSEFRLMHVAMTEVAKLYASQPLWRDTAKELPEIGHHVEVITEYESKGYPASARFIGYMNEECDLISLPDDDHYGWTFEECVTYWRYLSPAAK